MSNLAQYPQISETVCGPHHPVKDSRRRSIRTPLSGDRAAKWTSPSFFLCPIRVNPISAGNFVASLARTRKTGEPVVRPSVYTLISKELRGLASLLQSQLKLGENCLWMFAGRGMPGRGRRAGSGSLLGQAVLDQPSGVRPS